MTRAASKPAPAEKPTGKIKVTRNGDTIEIAADKLEHFLEFGWIKVG